MAIFNANGVQLSSAYNVNGSELNEAFDVNGVKVFLKGPDYSKYTNYTYTQKWSSKGIGSTQGFDIFDGKVFWVAKSGDASIPSNCYVWNLSDGSQALDTAYITIYSGHGNNICFARDSNQIIATPAYPPSRVFINSFTDDYTMTLAKTLVLDDGSTDCDACFDENDESIMWSLGHTANSQDLTAPYKISKWDLTTLTDNGDGTYTPRMISSIEIQQPSNSYFFQGCKFHDGLLWYANGYSGTSTWAYVYGVNPTTGETVATINCNTKSEPEGIAWVEDATSYGGYVMYVGFQGMMLRKYTFEVTA